MNIVLFSSRAVSVLRRKQKRSVVSNEQNMTVCGKCEMLEILCDETQASGYGLVVPDVAQCN